MSRRNRPSHLVTIQGNENPLETRQAFWQMRASKGGTNYITYVGYSKPTTVVSDEAWMISKSTYDGSGNLVVRQMAAANTGLADFDQIWDASSAFTINNITQASPGQVTTTTAHGYTTGDEVEIDSVVGMTEVNSDDYGSITFTVTVVDATNFTIGVNTTGYTGYSSAGSVYKRDYLNLTYS